MAVINFIVLAPGHNVKRSCSKLDHFRAGRKKNVSTVKTAELTEI